MMAVEDVRAGPGEAPALLTTEEACAYLRVSRRTLYRLLATGEVRQTRSRAAPGLVRYARAELDRWIALGTRKRR